MRKSILLICLGMLITISSCTKKSNPVDLLVKPNGWHLKSLSLEDTLIKVERYTTQDTKISYDILRYIHYVNGNTLKYTTNFEYDSLNYSKIDRAIQIDYFKNNLTVTFYENGTFHIDLDRQLTGDTISYVNNGVPVVGIGHTYTNPANKESLEGIWEWSKNSSDKAILYFHEPRFFQFLSGDEYLEIFSYKAPFVVQKISETELELEFVNNFRVEENFSTEPYYFEKIFHGINKISLQAK